MESSRATGFTLVELVVVMVLTAILAAVAAPRFFNRGDIEGPAFAQELAAAARYAQKLAVNTGCPVRLELTDATHYRLLQPQAAPAPACDSDFSRDVLHPASGEPFAGTAPPGTLVGGAPLALQFSAAGIPAVGGVALAAPLTLAVGGKTVTILAGSGYVSVQ